MVLFILCSVSFPGCLFPMPASLDDQRAHTQGKLRLQATLSHKLYHSFPSAPGQVVVPPIDAAFHTYVLTGISDEDFEAFAVRLCFQGWDFYPKSGALWLRGKFEDWRFLLRAAPSLPPQHGQALAR